MGRDRSGRQDMDLRFLITIALLLFAALSVTQRGPWVRFGGWPLYTSSLHANDFSEFSISLYAAVWVSG